MKKNDDERFFTHTTEDACAALGISHSTLYAYVSRGLLRAIKDPSESRRSLYDRRDIAQLSRRKSRGRSRRAVAASTLDWGEPVLVSSITRVSKGALFYREENARTLSQTATLESVGELLIGLPLDFTLSPAGEHDEAADPKQSPYARALRCLTRLATIENPIGNMHGPGALLQICAQHAAGTQRNEPSAIHEMLAEAWSDHPEAPDLIRRALVLCADHELNASTYAARVAASAGANLPACLLSGLATLSGTRHGGLTPICLDFMKAAEKKSDRRITRALRESPPPGFGHHLYPDGDPRATEILEHCKPSARWIEITDLVASEAGLLPNLDFALALLSDRLELPHGAGLGIFAVGRMTGWIAHALEQGASGKIIRPRARYVEKQGE